MFKYMMFEDIPKDAKIMHPSGLIETVEQVIERYPILGTEVGVIGFATDEKGTVGKMISMGAYGNIHTFTESFAKQGADITDDMTNAEKCDAITEFANEPINDDEDALDTYLSM